MNNKLRYAIVTATALLALPSCQQQNSTAVQYSNYPDAVVSLNQVDARYRPYFAAQHGASYDKATQRKAFFAAQETARTPVPSSVGAPDRSSSSSRRAVASRKPAASRKTAVASRKTATSRNRSVASRGKNAKTSKSVTRTALARSGRR